MAGIIFAEGTGLNDSVFGKSQAPIKAMIEQNVEAFEKQSMIDKIYYMDTTTHYAEKYTSETSMGDFEDVGENGAYPITSIQEGYSKTIEPTTWKSRFEVTRTWARSSPARICSLCPTTAPARSSQLTF